MDQSVSRTQYDAGTIRKFKHMSGVAALLMVLLLLRGDRGSGVEPSPASPVAKSIDFDAASRDATEATDAAAAAAAQLVGTLDAARDAAVRLRGVAAAAAHKKRVADRAAAAAKGGGVGLVKRQHVNPYQRERGYITLSKTTARHGYQSAH